MSDPVLSSYRFIILDPSNPLTPEEVYPIKTQFELDLEEVRRMLDGE